jgi:hypothetical protein
MDIEQMAQYIRIYDKSYIQSCLLAWLGRRRKGQCTHGPYPSLPPRSVRCHYPLDPTALQLIVDKFGFPYRTRTGLLIFSVQIGRCDIAPSVTILCKFNDRPAEVQFRAAKTVTRYLHRTIERGLIYWQPSGKERSDLPHGSLTPLRPVRSIDSLFLATHPLLKPICYVDASYDGLLALGDPRFVTGVVITLGGTAIFARTHIQRTTSLSATESKIIAGCDAGKVIKYCNQLFTEL